MNGLHFPIAAFLISILLLLIFFLKNNYKNTETKIYSYLVLLNFVSAITAIFVYVFAKTVGDIYIIGIIQRIYCIFLLLEMWLLYVYVLHVLDLSNKLFKAMFFTSIGLNIFAIVSSFFMPMEVINYGDVLDGSGMAYVILYIPMILYMFLMIIEVAHAVFTKKISFSFKKIYPLYILVALVFFAFFLRESFPNIIFETFLSSYVFLIMYFTIENPDVKMVNQLEYAKDAAEKANSAKTDFLSSMSHEIRTPLNAVTGFSQAIANSTTLEEAKENVEDILEASRTLIEIVNGILDISKIESGKMEIVNSPYDAKELFVSLGKLVKPRIEEKGIEFKVNISEDLPEVLNGDYANIKKVVTNLLTNALKYTDKGIITYKVDSVVYNQLCRLIITVEDTGRGIRKKNIDKLFTKFERLDEKNTTIEGTGLGLAITKQIVEFMGGEIVVQSVYGSGSKFTVALTQKIDNIDVSKKLKKKIINKKDLDLNGKRILVVDDNRLNLKVASKIMSVYNNPTIKLINNGAEAIEKIKSGENFDLILMDDMMPRLSGVETLMELKKIENFKIPVVALTANAITGMREKYIAHGFDDYLPKPINSSELEDILIRFLAD